MRGRLVALVAVIAGIAVSSGVGVALAGTAAGAAVPRITFRAVEDGWYKVTVKPAAPVRVTLQSGGDCNFLTSLCKTYDTIDSKLIPKGQVGHVSWIQASYWGQPPSRHGDVLYPGRYRMIFQVPGVKASAISTTWNLQFGD